MAFFSYKSEIMKTSFFILILLLKLSNLAAQNQQEQQLIKVLETFFEGLHEADTNKIKTVVHPDFRVLTTLTQMAKPYYASMSGQNFLQGVMNPRKRPWREHLWTYDIHVDANLATITTEYTFYLGADDKGIAHCGVNVFTVVQTPEEEWRIVQIADTRRNENCIDKATTQQTKDRINKLMDSWHKAAAEADEDTFFDELMTKDAIYLGTDASERWLRDELKEWSKVHFDKESAWSFTANWRNVYLANNQRMAWFEESLDTWMGECRGSGVVERINGEWKIKHYNLSIMVPNDIVKDFISLVKNGPSTDESNTKKSKKKKKKAK